MSQALFEQSGSQSKKQVSWAPIVTETYFEGLFTNRAPLHPGGTIVENRFYGGRPGQILAGQNTFLNNQLAIQRRPGHSAFSAFTYPTAPVYAFSFPQTDGGLFVIIDTGTSGNLTLTSVGASSGGSAVYVGTFPNFGSNAAVGLKFSITGFVGANNNGTNLVCTASSTTHLTLTTSIATAETHAAVAVTAGGSYYDLQNGSAQFLYGKSQGAGQSGMVAVAGILYVGDGVDTWIWNPTNTGPNGEIFAWGIEAPLAAPTVAIVPSGSASIAWTASTVFSTMGLVNDAANNAMYQLISVNASTTNTTQLGTTGNGQPLWAGIGGTTTDNTITWTNAGPIVLWSAATTYNNASIGGTSTNPCIVYDPKTKACYIVANPGNKAGTSGGQYPAFKAGVGQSTEDGTVKWFYIGTPGIPSTWKASTSYPKVGTVSNNDVVTTVVEPTGLANGLPTGTTAPVLYWQQSSGGTSGAGGVSPFTPATNMVGTTTDDGDLIWQSLGASNWIATTPVSEWTAVGTVFNAIVDPNGNFQVCIQTGVTGTVAPSTVYTLTKAEAATPSAGFTTYLYSSTTAVPIGAGNLPLVVAGFTNAGNNGTFTIVSSTATSVTVVNAGSTTEIHAGTGVYNPWSGVNGGGYGVTTADGTAVWTNVGSSMTWAVSTQWFLPTDGFTPPSSSDPYGGCSVVDNNGDVEFIINSGKSGSSHPSWASIGSYTPDNATSYTLSQVTVNANGTSTYTGTGLTGLTGQQLLVAGFPTHAGNNILIVPISSSATTLVVTTTSQVNETHAATAKGVGAIWYNLEAFSANSLAWSYGLCYAYSFEARGLGDYYSVNVTGTSVPPVPPGLSNPLPAPAGSQTGDVSSASPTFQITGSNSGSVNTIGGVGSTNPAVDTIIIWRSTDETDGSSNMLELTAIPAPPPINGIAQAWSFKDYLPQVPTTINGIAYPGLDELAPAPIDDVNDPPPAGTIPQVFSFNRIWAILDQTITFSGGPDTLVGNPQSAWNPSDEFSFLSTPVRAVRTTQGLVCFTQGDIEIILGGPATSSFYQVVLVSGCGLLSYNALDIFAGEIFFFGSDNVLRVVSPSLSLTNAGFAIEDQLANQPVTGISDTTWDPSDVYVAVLQSGNDSALFLCDGSTGYYRLNPRQQNGSVNGTEPIWSPFAAVTGGMQMGVVIQTQPGIRKFLVGSPSGGSQVLEYSPTIYTDNGTQYDAWFIQGALAIARRGETGILRFLEADFSGTSYQPTVSFLLNVPYNSATQGSFVEFTAAPQFDPPSVYGATVTPVGISPNRYYFLGTASLARGNYLTLKIDFGTTANPDTIYNLTIDGAILKGQ